LAETKRSGIPHCKHYLLRALKGWTLADLEAAAGVPSLRGQSDGATALGFGLRGNGTGRGSLDQRRSATGISQEDSVHCGVASAAVLRTENHSDAACIKRSASDLASARLSPCSRSVP